MRARAGTGKTAAFAVAALAAVADAGDPSTRALILAPTRELALQTAAVIAAIAPRTLPAVAVAAFVGGLPLAGDAARLKRPAHVVAATPGRAAALVERGLLRLDRVALLVLDEADALLGPQLARDVARVAAAASSPTRQTLAFSATLDGPAADAAAAMMTSPVAVDAAPGRGAALDGVAHFWAPAGDGSPASRAAAAVAALGAAPFCQAAAFSATRAGAASLAAALARAGFPPALLSGGLPQADRCAAVDDLRAFRARVAVATDVGARGVDLDRVNAVLNADGPPRDAATLAHRAGRAGRFGGRGACVTLCAEGGAELERLTSLLAELGAPPPARLPAVLPTAVYAYEPPSTEERETHARMLALREAAASGAAGEEDEAGASPPPPSPSTRYSRDALLALRPAARAPQPAGLPPAVALAPPPPPPPAKAAPRSPPAPPTPAPPPRARRAAPAGELSDGALEAAILAIHAAAAADASSDGDAASDACRALVWEADDAPPVSAPPAATPPPPCRACGATPLHPSPPSPADPLVAVPASLLRRYYELEYDAWAGRAAAARAWREGAGRG